MNIGCFLVNCNYKFFKQAFSIFEKKGGKHILIKLIVFDSKLLDKVVLNGEGKGAPTKTFEFHIILVLDQNLH